MSDFLLPLDRLPDPLPIPVIERPFDVSVRPPGSKSITNRALLLAALADGTSTLRGALVEADDAQVMIAALRQLGAGIEIDGDTVRVTGVAGRWKIAPGEEVRLDLHNAGTATRFLTAAALLAPAGTSVVIDGDARMRQRPIGELVAAMNVLTDPAPCVEHTGEDGYPPLRVRPDRAAWASGMVQSFGRTQSSQFISALLLIAPLLPHGMEVRFTTDDVTSRSYIDMTIGLLRRVGVAVTARDDGSIAVRPARVASNQASGTVRAFELEIEPDASGATYFEAAAAVCPGSRVRVEGLDLGPRGSLQGDTAFVGVLTAMGCRVERGGGGMVVHGPARLLPIDFDLSDMPDTAMTAAVLACFASPTAENPEAVTTLRGLRTLRVKETDRMEALRVELSKMGAGVEIIRDGEDEGLRVRAIRGVSDASSGSAGLPRVEFDTYNDHRMAMALALVGLRVRGVKIRNPACVAKTYPTYWRDLAKIFA